MAMKQLTRMRCEACRKDSPLATKAEIAEFLPQIPEWRMVERDGIRRLERVYKFDDFSGALAFTNKVGELAEGEWHHPDIRTEWGKVTLTWWTHKIGGLHRNDFIMAAKSDRIYAASAG